MTPLAVDLFCGLGGWTDGLLAEGYDVVGFDIERHVYGEARYPAQLVLQDILTIHGRQFKDAALIVASPPCQEFSYMAMPWSKAKEKQRRILADKSEQKRLTALFDACFRIQREACEAAGRHIPLVVENVRGAQKWVGRSRWNFGSFHLWGDVPALMPITKRAIKGHGGAWFKDAETADGTYGAGNFRIGVDRATKNNGGSWFNIAHNTTSGKGRNPVNAPDIGHLVERLRKADAQRCVEPGCSEPAPPYCARHRGDWLSNLEGVKQRGSGREWFAGEGKISRLTSSKSTARKAASAAIAKIPLVLARHVARAWRPA